MIKLLDHTALPVRDREAARKRFPDAAFNRWLDEGISDAGHTVWDQIHDVCDAWHGWMNRSFYESAAPAALPGGHPKLYDWMRREITDAIYAAEHPSGMSTHDGMVKIKYDTLVRLFDIARYPARPALAAALPAKDEPGPGETLHD